MRFFAPAVSVVDEDSFAIIDEGINRGIAVSKSHGGPLDDDTQLTVEEYAHCVEQLICEQLGLA